MNILTITITWANPADDNLMTFSYFSQKTGFDISSYGLLRQISLLFKKNK